MNKRNLLILGVVLILIIIGVVFGLQKKEVTEPVVEVKKEVKVEEAREIAETNEESTQIEVPEIDTSNWKTYRNESCGFEILIPESWSILSDLDCLKHPNKIPEGMNETYLGVLFSNPKGPLNNQPVPFDMKITPFKNYTKTEIEEKVWLTKYTSIKYIKNTYNTDIYHYNCFLPTGICDERNFIVINDKYKNIFVIDVMFLYNKDSVDYIYNKSVLNIIFKSFKFLD